VGSPAKPRERSVVYVVEPHPLAACHLALALKRNPALEVILSDINLPTDAALSNKRSILIIDADALPFPLAPFLHTLRIPLGDAQILVIGNRVPDEKLCRLLFHGVRGFVAYDKVEQEICAAVDALLGGHMWHAPQVLERYAMLSSALAKQDGGKHAALSPRESEVVGLLQRRLSNKEIGCALGISERTVRYHLHNVFEKLGVHDRWSVVEWGRAAARAHSGGQVSAWKAA
jgi:DNA-binding NarL/FixJ family response regulator